MSFLRFVASAGAAVLLLLGAAPAARAEATPSPAGSTAPARTEGAQAPASAEDYAAREAKAPELAKFEGGEYEHIYIGSSVVVVLLVVLIVVLVIRAARFAHGRGRPLSPTP